MSRWGAGIRSDGKWGVYMVVAGKERKWTDNLITDDVMLAVAYASRKNRAYEQTLDDIPVRPPDALENPEDSQTIHIPLAGCGHPYKRRRGHPPRLCETCLKTKQ